MNREQMLSSLQRIFVLQYFKPEEIGPYAETIYEQVSWMDGYRFDSVVKEILKTLKTNQRLKPAHFIGAYRQLSDEHGWNRGVTRHCQGCGGTHFVYVWVRDKKGLEFRATRGCAECNPKYSQIHQDFTELTGPTFEPIDRTLNLRKLSPAFAQLLLNISNSYGIELKRDIADGLMEAAAAPAPKDYGPRRLSETKRKNELVRAMQVAPVTVQEEPEGEASVDSQPVDVVEESASGSPPHQEDEERKAPHVELSEEDLENIPF